MSKEFISNAVLDDRAIQSQPLDFVVGGLAGIQISQSGHVAATADPDAALDVSGSFGIAVILGLVPRNRWVRLGQEGREASATIGRAVVSVAADLTSANRRDVSSTLEFASRYADALVPEAGGDVTPWSWFHNYVAAISKLGWTARSSGPQDVDPAQTPTSITTVAEVIIGIVNADNTFDSEPKQLIHRTLGMMKLTASMGTGPIKTYPPFRASETEPSFAVTAASVKDGVLTMRMIGIEFRSTERPSQPHAGDFARTVWCAQSMRKEIVDFTAVQSDLDEHWVDVLRRLCGKVVGGAEDASQCEV